MENISPTYSSYGLIYEISKDFSYEIYVNDILVDKGDGENKFFSSGDIACYHLIKAGENIIDIWIGQAGKKINRNEKSKRKLNNNARFLIGLDKIELYDEGGQFSQKTIPQRDSEVNYQAAQAVEFPIHTQIKFMDETKSTNGKWIDADDLVLGKELELEVKEKLNQIYKLLTEKKWEQYNKENRFKYARSSESYPLRGNADFVSKTDIKVLEEFTNSPNIQLDFDVSNLVCYLEGHSRIVRCKRKDDNEALLWRNKNDSAIISQMKFGFSKINKKLEIID